MTDTKPSGPFALTPGRIMLLVFGIIALVYIVGALLGGVENYDQLKQARNAAISSAEDAQRTAAEAVASSTDN